MTFAAGEVRVGARLEQRLDNGGSGPAPLRGLRVMVPNTPGSGYDTTARAGAKAMEDAGLARNVEVFNLAGASGTVGLQRLVNEKGNEKLLMQMGLGVVGAVFTNKSKATLQQTTPVARLIEEAAAIVVPKDSPYRSLDDLVTAWKANPGKLPVGGRRGDQRRVLRPAAGYGGRRMAHRTRDRASATGGNGYRLPGRDCARRPSDMDRHTLTGAVRPGLRRAPPCPADLNGQPQRGRRRLHGLRHLTTHRRPVPRVLDGASTPRSNVRSVTCRPVRGRRQPPAGYPASTLRCSRHDPDERIS